MALARAVSEERIMVARPLSPPSDLALNPMAGATFAQSTALPCHVTPAGRRITKEMLRQRSPGRGKKRAAFNQQLTSSRPRASKHSAMARKPISDFLSGQFWRGS
jgi:hypothetical protein